MVSFLLLHSFYLTNTSSEPTFVQTSTQSSNSVTITVTLPADIAAAHEVNVSLTPRSQRTATRSNGGDTHPVYDTNPFTTAVLPRVPRFNISEHPVPATPPNSVYTGTDPFLSGGHLRNGIDRMPGSRGIVNVSDNDSDDEDLSPVAIYPLRDSQTSSNICRESMPANAKYYVITKGKKIGVFFDTWCVILSVNILTLLIVPNDRNRVEPLTMRRQGGVYSKQDTYTDAKLVWDQTALAEKRVIF